MLDENLPVSAVAVEEQGSSEASMTGRSLLASSSIRIVKKNVFFTDAKPEPVAVVFNVHTSPKSRFRGRTFTFRCNSTAECNDWVEALRKAVSTARRASTLVSFHQKFQVCTRSLKQRVVCSAHQPALLGHALLGSACCFPQRCGVMKLKLISFSPVDVSPVLSPRFSLPLLASSRFSLFSPSLFPPLSSPSLLSSPPPIVIDPLLLGSSSTHNSRAPPNSRSAIRRCRLSRPCDRSWLSASPPPSSCQASSSTWPRCERAKNH
jgi:hypothetical protein